MDALEKNSVYELETEAVLEALFESISAILDSLMDTEKIFLRTTFRRVAESEAVRGKIRDIIPYMYAASLLSLAGLEINDGTLTRIISSVDIAVNPEYTTMVSAVWKKSHLLCIYAYYFINVSGTKDITKERLIKVVSSLGGNADEKTAEETLAFIKARESAQAILAFGKKDI